MVRVTSLIGIFCFVSVLCLSQNNSVDSCFNTEDPVSCLRGLDPQNDLDKAGLHVSLASEYLSRGELDQALKYGFLAIDEATNAKNHKLHVRALLTVGETYRRVPDFESSLAQFTKAKQLALNDSVFLPRIFNTVGILYNQLGDYDASKAQLDSGFAIASKLNDTLGMAKLLTNLGFLNNRAGNYPLAIDYYNKSIALKEQINVPTSLAYSLNDLGEVYALTGDFNKARSLSKKALQLATDASHLYYMRDMNRTLAQTYEWMGRYDSAYHHQLVFQALQDSISSEDRAREIAALEKAQEIRMKDRSNAELQHTIDRNRLELLYRNVLLIASGIILLILLLFGWFVYRSNSDRKELLQAVQQKNQALDHQNKHLKKSLNEQESLFNIVTHDIRGPLANVTQLLDLEQHEKDTKSKEEMRKMVRVSVERAMQFIEDFDTIHALEKNTSEAVPSEFDLADYINEIMEDFKMDIAAKKLEIHFESDKSVPITSVKEYVRHILYNVLANAIKYSPVGGNIFITAVGGEAPRVSIEDEGPGISPEDKERIFERFFRGSELRQDAMYKSSGLGLALTKLLVDKLGGRIRVKSALKRGTEFIINFS